MFRGLINFYRITKKLKKFDKNNLQKRLLNRNIQTGIHYQPNHKLSYYKDFNTLPLLNTDKIFPELLSLPLHPDLNISDIEYVVKKLLEEIELC